MLLGGEGCVIGLDVGGTVLKAVVVGPDGEVTHRQRQPTMAAEGPDALLDRVVSMLSAMCGDLDRDGTPVTAVGLAVPGLVDETAGVVRFAANLGLKDVQVTSIVSQRLGVPAYLGHDVRSGALAEGVLGAACGVQDFLFLPVGTGIAAAVVLGGRVQVGTSGGAGEIGHLVVEADGPPCRCGARGCLETLASASALARRYRELVPGPPLDADVVAGLAASGDPSAAAVWSSVVDVLGRALAYAQSLLDLDLVVVGGGLANAGNLLGDLGVVVASHLPWQKSPRLAKAALGDAAGSLGAALVARAGGRAVHLGRDAGPSQ